MPRFARLANAFSKKVENHDHMLAIYYMYYNFCRFQQSCGSLLLWKPELPITSGQSRN